MANGNNDDQITQQQIEVTEIQNRSVAVGTFLAHRSYTVADFNNPQNCGDYVKALQSVLIIACKANGWLMVLDRQNFEVVVEDQSYSQNNKLIDLIEGITTLEYSLRNMTQVYIFISYNLQGENDSASVPQINYYEILLDNAKKVEPIVILNLNLDVVVDSARYRDLSGLSYKISAGDTYLVVFIQSASTQTHSAFTVLYFCPMDGHIANVFTPTTCKAAGRQEDTDRRQYYVYQ